MGHLHTVAILVHASDHVLSFPVALLRDWSKKLESLFVLSALQQGVALLKAGRGGQSGAEQA
jgi:hypothetical protein